MLFWFLTVLQILLLVSGAFILGRIAYILYTFHKNKVPYVPIVGFAVKKMLEFAKCVENHAGSRPIKIIDLGSGAGKMVFHIAKNTPSYVKVYGIERSPLLYFCAKLRFLFSPKKKRIHLIYGNWDNITLSDFDYVFIFLTTPGLTLLLPKFIKEVSPNAKIVSYLFKLPENNVFVEKKYPWDKRERVYIYEKIPN